MARRLAVVLAAAAALGACTVLPVEEARRIRDAQNGQFDARDYVTQLWTPKTREELRARAVPIAQLRQGSLDALGQASGTRAGEGSPWTFVTQASGTVKAVALDQARGSVTLATAQGDVQVQSGPVVSGTAIRDAIPAINFDDFPSQIAFAEVGQGLTDRAIGEVRPALARLKVGDRVAVLGVTSARDANAPVVLTPFAVTAERAAR
jgi:predicted lipoprotein